MSKVINASIDLEDREAAKEILKILKAPVTDANVLNLRTVIIELGELFEESYNKMLVDMTNQKLAIYDCKCECGRSVSVDVSSGDIFEGAYHV